MNKVLTLIVFVAALFAADTTTAHEGKHHKDHLYGHGQNMKDAGYHKHKGRPYWHKHVNGKVITPVKEDRRARHDLKDSGYHKHKSRPYWHKHVAGKIVRPGCERANIHLHSYHCHNGQDINSWRVTDSAKEYKVELPKKMKLVPHDAAYLADHNQWRD